MPETKPKNKIAERIQTAARNRYRYIRQEGGAWSGKTYTTVATLCRWAWEHPFVIDITSPTMPHLKAGAMADWKAIMENNGIYDYRLHNKTDHTYTFPSGAVMRFFALDDEGKARGPRRDILFINEANLLKRKTFRNLSLRTRMIVLFDYNPVDEMSWVYEDFDSEPRCYTIHSTYADNPALSDDVKRDIESLKDKDDNLWQIYGLGLRGKVEGLVLPNHRTTHEWPDDYKWRAFGLDWGFTNDPSVLVEIRCAHGDLYWKQHMYSKNMTNAEIAEIVKPVTGDEKVICDSAEPKSVEELRRYGVNTAPSRKGRDSVRAGIQQMKHYKHLISESPDVAKEFRSYMWKRDKEDKPTNEPVDTNNHAIDAGRYAIMDKLSKKTVESFLV